jgi:transposase-like protein
MLFVRQLRGCATFGGRPVGNSRPMIKAHIVLEGLRGEESIAELCRREGIVRNLYYRWSKDFLETGKKRLTVDTTRTATSDEIKDMRRDASDLKEVLAELTLENCLLKKA